MIASLIASGFEIPQLDHSSDKDNREDRKMAAYKKNSNLTNTKKRRK